MPPARLTDVMLLREWSSWQAGPHGKFEECTQGFDRKFGGGYAEIQLREIALRLARRAVGEGGAYKLSNGGIAQFLCNSFVSPTPAHASGSNSPVQ
jgi:hypothetical protein